MSREAFPADRLQPLADWLASDAGAEFYKLLGMRTSDHFGTAALLSKIPTYYGGAFPMFKDDLDRWTCDVTFATVENARVPIEVRRAFALLWQQFSSLGDALHMCRQRKDPRRGPPFNPGGYPRPPIVGPGGYGR